MLLLGIRAILVCLVPGRGRPEERGGASWRPEMLRKKSTVTAPTERQSTSVTVERGKLGRSVKGGLWRGTR